MNAATDSDSRCAAAPGRPWVANERKCETFVHAPAAQRSVGQTNFVIPGRATAAGGGAAFQSKVAGIRSSCEFKA